MLGTDNTLKSGHLLLLVLVTSLTILGFGYLNEMYQRIQLQTNLAILERQTQHSVSERLIIEHKTGQLQMKLEAAYQEKKRLEDMHEFQSQQQNANFQKEKQELLEDITLKEKETAKLQDQYESLKLRFHNLHLVMEQFEKNQSRLLEKFATQSTQCLNVIKMMSELCNKSENKIHKILPFIREKKTLMTAVTSQSSAVTKKHENISAVSSQEGAFANPQMPLMQAITDILFPSGGNQSALTYGPKGKDPSSKPKNQGIDQNNALAPKMAAQGSYLNVTTHEKIKSTDEQALLALRNDSFQIEGNLNETIIKNDTNENFDILQRIKEKLLLDLDQSNQNQFGNVRYSEHPAKNEGIALKNLDLQLTNSSNVTRRNIFNIIQDDDDGKPNLTLSEGKKIVTAIGQKSTKKITKINSEDALSSLLDVYNTEEKDKDGIIEGEKIKDEKIHLRDTDNESREKVLQTLETEYID